MIPASQPACVLVRDQAWTIRTLGQKLPKMLDRAGYREIAEATDLAMVRSVLPDVEAIDSKMKEWCREWTQTPSLPNGAGSGVFNDLWWIIEEYYRKHLRQH